MNWQIIVGVLLLIGGIGNLVQNFSGFVFGTVTGSALIYWGLKKKGITFSKEKKRTLKEENFQVAGVGYYENAINKLACANPDWKLTAAQIINSGRAGRRIFRYNYVNKPIKLIPEPGNEHDPNAIVVMIAGEKVGYISKEENTHVREILQKHEIVSLSGFIGGSEYKIISEDSHVSQFDSGFHINVRIKYI